MIVLIGGEEAATPSSLKPICGWAFGWVFGAFLFFAVTAFYDPSIPAISKIAGPQTQGRIREKKISFAFVNKKHTDSQAIVGMLKNKS